MGHGYNNILILKHFSSPNNLMYKPVHNKDDYKHSYFKLTWHRGMRYPFVVLNDDSFYRQERWSVNCADARSISDLHKISILNKNY